MKLELELDERQTSLLKVKAAELGTGLIGAATQILDRGLLQVEVQVGKESASTLANELGKN